MLKEAYMVIETERLCLREMTENDFDMAILVKGAKRGVVLIERK